MKGPRGPNFWKKGPRGPESALGESMEGHGFAMVGEFLRDLRNLIPVVFN